MPGAAVRLDTAMLFEQEDHHHPVFDSPIAKTPVLKLVGVDETLLTQDEDEFTALEDTIALDANNTTDDDIVTEDAAETTEAAAEPEDNIPNTTLITPPAPKPPPPIPIATLLPRLISISRTQLLLLLRRSTPTPPTIDTQSASTIFRTTHPAPTPRFTFTYNTRPPNVGPLSAGPAGHAYMPLWTRPGGYESLKYDHAVSGPRRDLWVLVRGLKGFLKRG